MIIAFLLLSAVGWLSGCIVFEGGYQALAGHVKHPGKDVLCKIWWALLTLTAFLSAGAQALIHVPLALAIGLSHTDLAAHREDVIPVVDILKNIGEASRKALHKLTPFIR